MYAIRSYYGRLVRDPWPDRCALGRDPPAAALRPPERDGPRDIRITSYNVCYTKLLRGVALLVLAHFHAFAGGKDLGAKGLAVPPGQKARNNFV